jgi:hypothetical protein
MKTPEMYSPQFGDLVEFRGKQWFFLGMSEDAAYHMVRRENGNAFECIEFEQLWHEDWDEIKLVGTYGLPQKITSDYVPWEKSSIQRKWMEWNMGGKKEVFEKWLENN